MQKTRHISHTKEPSRQHCAKKCCMTKGCAGFSFDNLRKDCLLSGTPWSKVPPTGGLLSVTKITCQKQGVHGGCIVLFQVFVEFFLDIVYLPPLSRIWLF